MNYLILTLAVTSFAAQSVCKKQYLTYKNSEENLFNLISTACVLIVYGIMFAITPDYHPGVFIYSLLFGVSFITVILFSILSLKHGALALTNLVLMLSLILVSFYGLIFWDEKITPAFIIGILLIVVSLVLILVKKGEKINLKWLIFSLLALAGNAGCSIVQKTQQLKFDGGYASMFMTFASLFAGLFFLVYYFKNRTTTFKAYAARDYSYSTASGIFNALTNLAVIYLATRMSANIVYPVICIGCILSVSLISFFVYKERFSLKQLLGILLGTAGIVIIGI